MGPQTLLAEWLAALPLPGGGVTMDDGHVAYVQVDGAWTIGVTVNPATRLLGFVAFLRPAMGPDEGALLHAVLGMNLVLLAQHGATLALDATSGQLVMGRTAPMDGLDAAGFAALLARTGELADALRTRIADLARTLPAGRGAETAAEAESTDTWLRL